MNTSKQLAYGHGRKPIQGVGVGLRTPHYSYVEQHQPAIPWFEVLIDNYLAKGGSPQYHLEQICSAYPVSFHAVGMSLGSSDPLNFKYLANLKELVQRYEPVQISDHLCWTSVDGIYTHDLLPLPYFEQAAQHAAERIQRIQDFLGQRLLLENVSSYLSYRHSVMQEWEFLNRVVELADCDVLLDINNIYVSARNHGFDAMDYLLAMPAERIREFHLAGYEDQGTHLLDTHGSAVHAPVWQLYRQALQRFGAVPTLIEWDNNIPAFEILQAEADKADSIMNEACHAVA